MTDAPETIWAKQTSGWGGLVRGSYQNTPGAHARTEYTRTDITQARIAELESTMKKDAKIYYDAKAIIDAHQVIYREAREEQRARIAQLEAALATAREDALREAASLCAETGAFAEEMEKPILALIGNEAK